MTEATAHLYPCAPPPYPGCDEGFPAASPFDDRRCWFHDGECAPDDAARCKAKGNARRFCACRSTQNEAALGTMAPPTGFRPQILSMTGTHQTRPGSDGFS